MLKLSGINKVFNKGTVNEKIAVKNLDFHAEKGDFITIIGGNGAGKSTLFNIISGVIIPDEGNVILDGEDITFQKEYKRAKKIGRLFQDPLKGTSPHMTVEENLSLSYCRGRGKTFSIGISKQEREMFHNILKELDLGLEERIKTKMGLLSGGQRQAVTLIMSTLVTPKLLLLDEHTAALDPVAAEKVIKLTEKIVEKDNITTLMITHNIKSSLQQGTRTIMLSDGNIIMDIKGEERANMTLEKLMNKFKIDNDR
ncbi:MAG: ATP-binding cassette domain-containing protein, partial [Oscillospiraceae bacterium]